MRILHLSTYGFQGGASTAAYNLHNCLRQNNVRSSFLSIYNPTKKNGIIVFGISDFFHRLLNRIKDKSFLFRWGAIEFSDDRSFFNVEKHPLIRESDILHLHWVAQMVDYWRFFNSTHGKPLVWTLHDMNPFTGGCHYSNGCHRYEVGCGLCPLLKSNNLFDASKKSFLRKKKSIKEKILVVSPSKWLAECAAKSEIFNGCEIKVIPQGVDLNVFCVHDKTSVRADLGLPKDKFLILFGACYSTPRKGLAELVNAVKILSQKIGPSTIALVFFGDMRRCNVPGLEVHHFGHIEDENFLAKIYSAADVFVCPSKEEAFGLTAIEAMACGTSVVGFEVGGLKDTIEDKVNGLLAKPSDYVDLSEKILFMFRHPKKRGEMHVNARKIAEKKYGILLQAQNYKKLYENILVGQ